jgi:type III restriction enzyme
MKLFKFQSDASSEIVKKFEGYAKNPLMIDKLRTIPFYQNLSAITGAGKTLILADTVTNIRASLAPEPIVLWVSKGKVVVGQTLANLSVGKYSKILGNFEVLPLLDATTELVEDSTKGLLLIATVAKFNVKDKEQGDRKIYQSELDASETTLWQRLKERWDSNKIKRPLVIVYDEGHNLSDQQTERLLELNPDAIIAASATTRIPAALDEIIRRLRKDKEWGDDDLSTAVKSTEVVKEGLIKDSIEMIGYITPMEVAIDDLLERMTLAEKKIKKLGLSIKPKAIYVSSTNVVETAKYADMPTKTPFSERQARPIVIWKHLVKRGVDPRYIAVYCNLKFGKENPPPPEFNLFSGGDNDYQKFTEGNYRHIIFNLGLQEGWDDPEAYFAYIDKEMGSRLQITQIIGRVLRQPGVTHYSEGILNEAHLFVRTDTKNVFLDVVKEVKKQLSSDTPDIKLRVSTVTSGKKDRPYSTVKKEEFLPLMDVNTEDAYKPVSDVLNTIPDFRNDKVNTVGQGERLTVLQKIGKDEDAEEKWVPVEHSNLVTARWILRQEVQKYYPTVLDICDIEHPKFDARVEYHSVASDIIRKAAFELVEAFLKNSEVIQNWAEPITVPDAPINEDTEEKFKNGLHPSYSDLNKLEEPFARALDKTGMSWFRNPSRGLFEIPLLDINKTKNFNPDFIVWNGKNKLVAIDTKGSHIIMGEASRKLFYIKPAGKKSLLVRFVSEGQWTDFQTQKDKSGFTVWVVKQGKVIPIPVGTIDDAVKTCMKDS